MEHVGPNDREQLALPIRLGGFGIGCLAGRHHAAYLGSWALCLHPVLARLPLADVASLRAALLDGDHSHPVARHVLDAGAGLQTLGVAAARLPDWESCCARSVQKQQRALTRHVAA
eukprot:4876293-Karenia_brevis.AAC.1